MAVPGMIATALQAERDGAHALVIGCMSDPGLDALREAVAIPVIGLAQTSMATAATLAHSFAFVTVLNRVVPILRDNASQCGFERHYAGCRALDIPVLEIHSRAPEEVQDRLGRLSLELVEQAGAGAIILGCGALLGCADGIQEYLAARGVLVPVIDPLPTAVAFAVTLVEQGLSHSRVSYPQFQMKRYTGYGFVGGMHG
jgi:allantoin racemase